MSGSDLFHLLMALGMKEFMKCSNLEKSVLRGLAYGRGAGHWAIILFSLGTFLISPHFVRS